MKVVYRGAAFERPNPPATLEQIATVEATLGVTFPDDYREFLRHVDGGVLERPICAAFSPQYDDHNELFVGKFYILYGVDRNNRHHIVGELNSYEISDRIPDKVVPVAVCHTDNPCCMSLREKDYGCLYLWNPKNIWAQEEDYPLEKSDKDLFLCANSFNEFLSLYDPSDRE